MRQIPERATFDITFSMRGPGHTTRFRQQRMKLGRNDTGSAAVGPNIERRRLRLETMKGPLAFKDTLRQYQTAIVETERVMPKRSLNLATFAVVAIVGAAAQAQPRMAPPYPESDAARMTTRAQITFNFFLPGNVADNLDEQRRLSDVGRKSIYEMANGECAQLQLVFKKACRLVNVNVQSSVQRRGTMADGMTITGSAQYELSPY